MKNTKINSILEELTSKIALEYKDFKGCYLYGSTLKNIQTAESDVDIVAIFDYIDTNKDLRLRRIICELMYRYDIYIDFHTYTLETLAQNPVYYDEVINKGLYYAAA